MKIAIVLPNSLPVPAVKGGAVQTGVQQIIDNNEIYGGYDLTIFSVHDNEAVIESQKYTKTKFRYIKANNKNPKKILTKINAISTKLKLNYSLNPSPVYTEKLIKELNKQEFDAVLIKNAVNFVLPLRKKTKHKLYLQLHNDYLNSTTPLGTNIYNSCEKIIVNSNYIKERVLTLPSANPKKIKINKNCTDDKLFDKTMYIQESQFLKNKYKIDNNDVVILFTGRTVKEKGIEELIIATKRIPENMNYKLLIVGSKNFGVETRNKFEKRLKNLTRDIQDNIIFTGYLPLEKVAELYSIVDIAVVPSIWEEPAGRVVLEAQASGVPVIVSDSGGIEDYLTEKSSIVVERGDLFIKSLSIAIIKLMLDKNLREVMGKEGQIFARKFNPYRYYLELGNLFI